MYRAKRRPVVVVSNNYNADSLDMLSLGGIERTKNIAKYSMIGMGIGVGYCLLTRKSIMLGLLVGTLGGMTLGTGIENIRK
jgi:hypothetical protein